MDPERKAQLLDGLNSSSPRERALTIEQVGQVDLDDLEVLDALLKCCVDATPLPEDLQPPPVEDPFADFFGKKKASAEPVPIAATACKRLVFTGVIGKPDTVQHLVRGLRQPQCGEALVKAVVKVLAETVWTDRLSAVKALVPELLARDASLYEVVVRFGQPEHQVMVKSALQPYCSRAVNELLNHQGSKPLMEEALGAGIVNQQLSLDEPSSADALTLLLSWDSSWAPRVAAVLQQSYPWALLVCAVYDPEQGAALKAWLPQNQGAPLALIRKLKESLKTFDDLPHWPLEEWLRYSAEGVDLVRQWRAADRCEVVLKERVAAWDEHPELGWMALIALVEAGLHEGLYERIQRALQGDLSGLTKVDLEVLARAKPPIPELLSSLTEVLAREPLRSRMIIPALMSAFPVEDLRPLAESYIALCEQQPVIRKPSKQGLLHEERQGVDPVPLQVLVNKLGDPALVNRLTDVLPYVRATE